MPRVINLLIYLPRASQVEQQFCSNAELEQVRKSAANLFMISSQFCPRLLENSTLSSQMGVVVTTSGISVVEIDGWRLGGVGGVSVVDATGCTVGSLVGVFVVDATGCIVGSLVLRSQNWISFYTGYSHPGEEKYHILVLDFCWVQNTIEFFQDQLGSKNNTTYKRVVELDRVPTKNS